jgi:RNA polymerase subunit RPABC4/transcription elongation factor Spt4
MYCGECGSEIDSGDKFCPECGAAASDTPEPEDVNRGETGACQKCDKQISTDADRCPECGFEPGPGVLGGIVMWVSGMVGLTFLAITLASLIVIVDGYSITQALPVVGLTGFISAVFLGIVYLGYKGARRGPTDEPIGSGDSDGSGDSKSLTESWEEGSERGERWVEQATAVYYSAVHGLPSWLWTVGVVLGVVLSFAMWPAAVTGNETAISISLLGGGGLLFFVVLLDTLRLTDAHDELNFRWWFWSIPAFLPLIGWLFGLTWLWRRHSKVNAVSN